MEDLNKEFNRISNLIRENKRKFDAIDSDDDFVWSAIEVETFLEIVKFGRAAGLQLSDEFVAMLFDNDEYNADREFEVSTYDAMLLVKETLENQKGNPPLMDELLEEMNVNFYE
jgi:hypothetical protein